jgi:hypothetical protein
VSNQTLEGRGICVGGGSESVKEDRLELGTGLLCECHCLKRSPHKPFNPSNKKKQITIFLLQSSTYMQAKSRRYQNRADYIMFSLFCPLIAFDYLKKNILTGTAYLWLWDCVHWVCRVLYIFSNRRNRYSPNPSAAGECPPSPPVLGGGTHSLAREGLGEFQFRRGDIHCGTLYIVYVLRGTEYSNQLLM